MLVNIHFSFTRCNYPAQCNLIWKLSWELHVFMAQTHPPSSFHQVFMENTDLAMTTCPRRRRWENKHWQPLFFFFFSPWCCWYALHLEQCSETSWFHWVRCIVITPFYSGNWQCWQLKQQYPGPSGNACLIAFLVGWEDGWVPSAYLHVSYLALYLCSFWNALSFP